ncbi:hypothetical protein C0992_009203 [Termitomyces sp. T32_za158]|nr:hypothetical protein C0992_009203 [Termitomyces sp. T32_za158]
MSSSLSSTTPVRAITTTLLTKSSPSVPSSSQNYEPIVKSILRTRLVGKVFLYSLISSWIFTSIWSIWNSGGVSHLGLSGALFVSFGPWTLLIALLSWTTAALPAAVLRKVYLSPRRTPATSLSALVKASLSKPATVNSSITYALSAVAALALHVVISYVTGNGNQGLTIFVKSKKHPLYLNGRLIFLVLSQLFAALAFSLRNITLDRFVFRWAHESTTRRFNVGDIVQSIVVAGLLATLVLPLAALVFGFVRFALPFLYKLPLLHIFLRPFTAHFLRGPWTIFLPFRHVFWLIRAWFLAFTTLIAWEFPNAIFDTFIYNPLSINGATPESSVTLVSGISSADLGYRYLAYKDIQRFSSAESETASSLRSSLFNDQKYNPNLWSHLVRESLLCLGKDYQHFLRRGKPAALPFKPPTPAAPATPSRPSVITNQTPLIRTSIFKASKASPIETVAGSLRSDGQLAQALDVGTAATHIPELFKSVEAVVLPAPKKEEVKKNVEKVEGIVDRHVKQAKEELRKVVVSNMPLRVNELGMQVNTWWNKERLEKTAQSCLPNMELDVVIVDVLSTLVCASLTEDKYGIVQRDIPGILEAMLSFLSAIQIYHFEVRSKYTPPVQDQVYTSEQIAESEAIRVEVEKACDVLDPLSECMPKKVSKSSKRTSLKRAAPTGGRRFFFKLELLKKRRAHRPFDYNNLDPIIDTPPEKVPVRNLFQSPHTYGKENIPSLPPSAPVSNLPVRNAPWHKRVALISEDHSEDAVIVTTLDTVPFCCHEDLITMSRKQLIDVACALNARLPVVLAIDTDEALATSWIRASIERVVGIRADVPRAPKVVKVLRDSNGSLERKWKGASSGVKMDRTLPTSPLASRSQQFGSLVSPGLDRLVEEDEEDDEEEVDRLSKRRKLVFEDTGGKSDSDVVMASDTEHTPTPLPQRARSCFLRAKISPSPVPTKVLRSQSQTIGAVTAIDTSFMYEGRPQARYQCKPTKGKVQAKTDEEPLPPIGASRRSGRLRPISRPRALLPAESSTLPHSDTATGSKRKRKVGLFRGDAAQHFISGISRMTMRSGNDLDSDRMDISM